MKKLFFILTAGLLALVACEPVNGPQGGNDEKKGTLAVVEKSVDLAFYGGEGVINYTLTDAAEGAKPAVEVNKEWVSNITVTDKITFDVALNDTAEKRVATVVVTYAEQSFNVFVEQAAGLVADVEFVATALNGEYYGTKYSVGHNYFAILSTKGTTGWGDLYLDTYYRFDMFSAIAVAAGDKVVLPKGIYVFDSFNGGEAGTFGQEYSVRMEPKADGNLVNEYFDEGVIIVTENRIEALVRISSNAGDGKVHHVVYEGSLELGYLEIPAPDYYSTLTEDYTFNHQQGVVRFYHYGDYYNVGGSNWSITAMLPGDPLNGDYILVDLVADKVSTNVSPDDAVGTYTCVASDALVDKNTFIAGGMEGTQYTYSWLQFIVDNYVDHSRRAPITSGTVTIAAEGTGYLLTFDCMDDNGHKITGTFNCPTVELYDRQ